MDDASIVITAEIVAAYISNNSVASTDLTKILSDVHGVVQRLGLPSSNPAPVEIKLVPAVPIKKSVTPDFIVCLDDGKKFKSLKRHLMGSFGITPDEYRMKWGLPADYPMVAPNYAALRSALAKSAGLGKQAGRAARSSRIYKAK